MAHERRLGHSLLCLLRLKVEESSPKIISYNLKSFQEFRALLGCCTGCLYRILNPAGLEK